MAWLLYGIEIALRCGRGPDERYNIRYKYLEPYAQHKIQSCFNEPRTLFQAPCYVQKRPFLETQPLQELGSKQDPAQSSSRSRTSLSQYG